MLVIQLIGLRSKLKTGRKKKKTCINRIYSCFVFYRYVFFMYFVILHMFTCESTIKLHFLSFPFGFKYVYLYLSLQFGGRSNI